MDDSADRLVEGLKVQIKKEIVDNYFADRVYLEEETELLGQEAEAYRKEYEAAGPPLHGLLPRPGLRGRLLPDHGRPEPQGLAFLRTILHPGGRGAGGTAQELPLRGFTAYRRFRNRILDLYEMLHRDSVLLQESYDKISTHVKLLNEDIDKFNLSYDFGLIAAQMEALEGRSEVLSGGLLSPEREELSSRMRFKRRKLDEQELPPPPNLPPLEQIKDRLVSIIDRICP